MSIQINVSTSDNHGGAVSIYLHAETAMLVDIISQIRRGITRIEFNNLLKKTNVAGEQVNVTTEDEIDTLKCKLSNMAWKLGEINKTL